MRRFLTRNQFVLILPIVTIGVVMVFSAIILLFSLFAQPSNLIDVGKYHLNTVSGQVAFATAVANTKAYEGHTIAVFEYFILGIVVIGIIGSAIVFYISLKKMVPWRITSYRTHDKSINESAATEEQVAEQLRDEAEPARQHAAKERGVSNQLSRRSRQ